MLPAVCNMGCLLQFPSFVSLSLARSLACQISYIMVYFPPCCDFGFHDDQAMCSYEYSIFVRLICYQSAWPELIVSF